MEPTLPQPPYRRQLELLAELLAQKGISPLGPMPGELLSKSQDLDFLLLTAP